MLHGLPQAGAYLPVLAKMSGSAGLKRTESTDSDPQENLEMGSDLLRTQHTHNGYAAGICCTCFILLRVLLNTRDSPQWTHEHGGWQMEVDTRRRGSRLRGKHMADGIVIIGGSIENIGGSRAVYRIMSLLRGLA